MLGTKTRVITVAAFIATLLMVLAACGADESTPTPVPTATPGLSAQDVTDIITQALQGQPEPAAGLTAEQVENIIGQAIEGVEGLTAEEVARIAMEAAEEAAAGGVTEEQLQAAVEQAAMEAAAEAAKTAVFQAELAALIRAAQAEGKLFIDATGGAAREHGSIVKAFGEQFGISVTFSTQDDPAPRIVVERDAGVYATDVLMVSTSPPEQILIPAGALRAIEPLLFFPDVINMDNWYGGQFWFTDSTQKYALTHSALLSPTLTEIWYNTEEIGDQIDELTSLWQFAREPFVPWIDKVVVVPPHISGAGEWASMYAHPELGPEFVFELILSTRVQKAVADQIIVNGMTSGKFAMTFLSSRRAGRELGDLAELGLPLALRIEGVDETPFISTGGSTRGITMLESPPNPNAQKLFINWWLSRDAVILRHELQAGPNVNTSLRIDVPIVSEFQVTPDTKGLVNADLEFVARKAIGRVFVQELSQCVEIQGADACRAQFQGDPRSGLQ